MGKKLRICSVGVFLSSTSAYGALTGPLPPASLPYGPTSVVASGSPAVQPGGRTFTYSGISTSQYAQLFDAVDNGDIKINNGLTSSIDTLSVASGLGTNSVVWTGFTAINDGVHPQYQLPVEFILTSSVGTFATGLVPFTDAALDLESALTASSASSFTLNFQWLGKPTGSSTYAALSTLNGTGPIGTSATNSFFYSSVPEPASISVAAIGAIGLLSRRRRVG